MIENQPFSLKKHYEVGTRLIEFQKFLSNLQDEVNAAGYSMNSAIIQISKKIQRLQNLLDDQCLLEHSNPEALFAYFNRLPGDKAPQSIL